MTSWYYYSCRFIPVSAIEFKESLDVFRPLLFSCALFGIKFIELKPYSADAWNNKGVSLYSLHQYTEALQAFDKVIELKPDYAEAWSVKGLSLIKLRRYDEALEAASKGIELNPNFASGWYNRACIYSSKGEKEKALSDLKKAIEIEPSFRAEAEKDEDFKNL